MAATLARRAAVAARQAGVRHLTVEAKAIRYSRNGHPTRVLKSETLKLDTATLKPTDVFVRMLAAPITPVDLAQVSGFSGAAASFPRVGGNEGIGIVEEAGASSGLKKGDVVVASKSGVGTWSTHVIAPADSFTAVNVDVKSAQLEAIAAAVAPVMVAKRLLATVPLAKGDVVVQNSASSTVAQAVVQLAAGAGVRTINIARPSAEWGKLVPHLQALGATIVVSDEQAGRHEFKKMLADFAAPKLGLNATGGASAGTVARALGEGATLVTYGAASGRPVTAPLDLFTHRDLTLKGFNLDKYARSLSKAARDAEASAAVSAVAADKLRLLVAREPFGDFAVALKRTYAPDQRKVVLRF